MEGTSFYARNFAKITGKFSKMFTITSKVTVRFIKPKHIESKMRKGFKKLDTVIVL